MLLFTQHSETRQWSNTLLWCWPLENLFNICGFPAPVIHTTDSHEYWQIAFTAGTPQLPSENYLPGNSGIPAPAWHHFSVPVGGFSTRQFVSLPSESLRGQWSCSKVQPSHWWKKEKKTNTSFSRLTLKFPIFLLWNLYWSLVCPSHVFFQVRYSQLADF